MEELDSELNSSDMVGIDLASAMSSLDGDYCSNEDVEGQ